MELDMVYFYLVHKLFLKVDLYERLKEMHIFQKEYFLYYNKTFINNKYF